MVITIRYPHISRMYYCIVKALAVVELQEFPTMLPFEDRVIEFDDAEIKLMSSKSVSLDIQEAVVIIENKVRVPCYKDQLNYSPMF